jgi:hypothetical protein
MFGYMSLYSVTHSLYIRQQQDFRAALTLNCRQASGSTLKIRLARFLCIFRSNRRDISNNIIPTPVRAHQFSILHISQEAPQGHSISCFVDCWLIADY